MMNRFSLRRVGLCLLVAGLSAQAVLAAELSPANWMTEGESIRADGAWGVQKSQALAVGRKHAIAGTSAPIAIRSGLEALNRGGSAADAVMAAAMGQIALAAGSWVSYAGFFQMMYFDAESKQVHNLNAAYNTVLDEDDPMSIPFPAFVTTGDMRAAPADTVTGRAVLVPGFMAGVEAASKRFGKLPFASLFEPAIHIAEAGFEVSPEMAGYFLWRKDVLKRLPETQATFFKSDGATYEAGEIFRQPALAKTLRAIAQEGASYMYEGPWASKFVAAVRADGGKISSKDLKRYEAIFETPTQTSHAGYDVYASGKSAAGGVNVSLGLNMVEAADIARRGHYAQDPEVLADLAKIANASAAGGALAGETVQDRAAIASKPFAAAVWSKLHGNGSAVPASGSHSDALVAVDQWGNVAAITHTINTVWWGELGMVVEGISIPDSGAFQQAGIVAAGPGNRLADPTEPVMILRDGRPAFAFASIATGLHYHTLTTLVNALDFGMDPKSAIDTPSLLTPGFGTEPGIESAVVVAGDFDQPILNQAEASGITVYEVEAKEAFWQGVGILVGLELDHQAGLIKAAAPYYGPGASYAR